MGITAQQFENLRRRVSQSKERKSGETLPAARQMASLEGRVVLGIDPSLRGTGYGVIKASRRHPTALSYGRIGCPGQWKRSRCLVLICQTLRDVIRDHKPEICAIEGLFHAQNLQTALIMGEARGAILATVAEAGLEIFEVAPRKMKLAIVGFGGAQKSAVARMVQRMLQLESEPDADSADALALALALAQEHNPFSLTPPKSV